MHIRSNIDIYFPDIQDFEAAHQKQEKTRKTLESRCDKLTEKAAEMQDMLGRVTVS